MAPAEQSGRTPEDQAEDRSTNEIGFRDVDEEADHDESGGDQQQSGSPPAREPER